MQLWSGPHNMVEYFIFDLIKNWLSATILGQYRFIFIFLLQDGTFKLTLEFSEEYPNKPPVVKFLSKMFHPNIYADGGICLDILQNRWSPTYDVSAILTSIQSLVIRFLEGLFRNAYKWKVFFSPKTKLGWELETNKMDNNIGRLGRPN